MIVKDSTPLYAQQVGVHDRREDDGGEQQPVPRHPARGETAMLTPHHHHGKPGDEQRSRQHQDIGKFVRFKDDAHRLGCPRTDRWSRIDMRSHLPLVLAAFALTAPYSAKAAPASHGTHHVDRSEEHTSELQSLMRISYAVFCLK